MILIGAIFVASGRSAAPDDPIDTQIRRNVAVLGDPNASAAQRRSAADALGRIGEPALESLIQLVSPGSRFALQDIAYAMGLMGPAPLPRCVALLGDADPFRRGFAASWIYSAATQGVDCTQALPGLHQILLQDDLEPGVQQAAIMALMQLNQLTPSDVPGLLNVAQGCEPEFLAKIVATLRQLEPTALALFPQPTADQSTLGASAAAQMDFNFRQALFEIGRLEYGRLDVNRDWKLAPTETTSDTLLSNPALDLDKKGFLSFEEAGTAAHAALMKGYKAGYRDAHPTEDVSKVDAMSDAGMIGRELARKLLKSLRTADLDGNRVLNETEMQAWRTQRRQ